MLRNPDENQPFLGASLLGEPDSACASLAAAQRQLAELAAENSAMAAELQCARQELNVMLESMGDAFFALDGKWRVIHINRRAEQFAGCKREHVLGRRLWEAAPGIRDSEVFPLYQEVMATREALSLETYWEPRQAWVELRIYPHGDGIAVYFLDISQRKESEERLAYLARHDILTGLPNRSFLNERLQHMLDSAPPYTPIAVMFIDLDRFKEVNDSMGHQAGDALLRMAARRLEDAIRPEDFVARLGGDEFVVAAYCRKGQASASAVARKALASLVAPFDIDGAEVFIGASIGISMFPDDGRTGVLLCQNADTAMYRAKAAGRNGYRFFEPAMSVAAKVRMTLETSLHRALERREFELHYQPRLDLKTMEVTGMEALLRWNHPQLGRISPLEFIPIAEERGHIDGIGRWVLEQACLQTRALAARLGRPLRVSVNLSARQLKCPDLVAQVEGILDRTGLAPALLELELTETALVEELDLSADMLRRIKQLGVALAVDDFGTGYSSLAYLRHFPLDVLKLDRSFVEQRSDGTDHFQFIKAFVDMAHALNLSVVAEGVEEADTLAFLKEAACDEVQGYLLARPMPVGELEAFLA